MDRGNAAATTAPRLPKAQLKLHLVSALLGLPQVQVAVPAEPVRPAVTRSSAIEIRLREGRSLVVEPGFEASHLRALLAVLESEV